MSENILKIPELSLVLLVGASGSGKSSFALKHFKESEVISSDKCRAIVSDDENSQAATPDAFDLLNFIASKRLKAGKLTVIDATNAQPEDRWKLIDLAREHHALSVAIVFNLDAKISVERNANRPNRQFGRHVIERHLDQIRRSLPRIKKEGFAQVYVLNSVEEVDSVRIERQPLWNNLKHVKGPLDIIGDVHGCFDELVELLRKLGYQIEKKERYEVAHPEGRKLIFVGDLVDRGPKVPETLELVMDMVEAGMAYCVNGNHDEKLKKKLMGADVKIAHGLAETLAQLDQRPAEFKARVVKFLDKLISHYVFDEGKLAVAHAGIKEEYIGRGSAKIREFCLFGETTGETDEFGLPVRYPWARDYRGSTIVVYGHTPIPEPEWLNNTVNIDTGSVFGGKLTALRYPEKQFVSVPAAKAYSDPIRPLSSSQVREANDILDIDDVIGKRVIFTELHHNITIREENAAAALEVMSRYAVDPRWLIYLPPTMSPPETSRQEGLLEHPGEVFDFYRKHGIEKVVCQEKHMGSRAIVVVCRDPDVARKRFGIVTTEVGVCYTRTGRHFFDDAKTQAAFLERLRIAIEKSKLWDELSTDWLCLDCELMPWSVKAQKLLVEQYAPVGAAAQLLLKEAVAQLARASAIDGIPELQKKFQERLQMAERYQEAYRRYCWPVKSLSDYKLAPFHILAGEGSHYMDKDHLWHMERIYRLCEADPEILRKTPYKVVDTRDESSCNDATQWWTDLTAKGGEGMVVKPLGFTVKGIKGLLQPGIKCRGSEYLRIIYGPEYTAPENLSRLRERHLSQKRSLALREYALGYEALKRFINKDPLYRVHVAVFGVLALESEPVDPRL